MKLNGTDNIITDLDVTVTGSKHLGNSLRTVVDDMDERIQSLEQQNKWLYANGGVGTGGGSGSGSTKWQIKAYLDNVEVTDSGTISLTNGAGNYDLRIYTSGGSDTYSVTYTYGNNISRTVSLSASNGWSTSVSVRITENGRISIIASDGSIRRSISGCNYVVTPYSFSNPGLYKSDGGAYPSGNSDIFVDDAKVSGIIIKSDYSIAIPRKSDLSDFRYLWLIDGVAINDWAVVEGTSGTLTYEFPSEFIDNNNAALHSYQLRISAQPEGTFEPTIMNLVGSFNLIPNNLYLKISPSDGETIYDSISILEPYKFNTNKSIGLFLRIYNGPNATGKNGSITWNIYYADGTTGISNSITVTDGVTYSVNLSFAKPGWNRVRFTYQIQGVSGTPVDKYFYCIESTTNYNWFVDYHIPINRRWYIAQANSDETKVSGISGIGVTNTPLYLQKKSADLTSTELTIDTYRANDQLINIGIQYNDINNTQNPILKLYSDASKTEGAITIYQNKVIFGRRFFDSEQECSIFLHKELNYDPEDRDKYHIISINIASCFYVREQESDLLLNNTYYEISVYIDGVLEGTVNAKPYRSPELYKIDLLPGNYAINQIDIAQFEATDGNKIIYDTDINWYWNSYKERIGQTVDESETELLALMFDANDRNNPTYSIENQLIKVNSALANNVALNANTPVLVLTCARDIVYGGDTYTIYDWMNTGYTDGAIGLNQMSVDIQSMQWSLGKSELRLIEIPDNTEYYGLNTHFILWLQGSSTMSNKSKNFTLDIAQDADIAAQGETVLFSPNYISGKPETFLPERAFTLKADVVDSSHSNNTAVGKFINENNTWQYREMQHQQNVDSEIMSHVKQCLEGFSMVVFLNVSYKDEGGNDQLDSYYLGIYNFNLGRNSYFNLGYCDLSQLDPEQLTAETVNGFTFCKVGGTKEGVVQKGITPLDGFVAAEVQDNSPYWDFSQYDDSILFPLPNSDESNGYMFGDIVQSTNTAIYTEGTIKNFVKSVAAAGGYLFNSIGKELVPCATIERIDGTDRQVTYHIPNKVSDYRTQYARTRIGSDVIYSPYQGDLNTLTESALEECILDDPEQSRTAKLDYESVVYYYTTCMALGLVDSVQKNLNIKTWSAANGGNGSKSGLFFYDMDTCLGKTNAGGKTSYFSFSDFWKSQITRYDSQNNVIPDGDNTTIAARVTNDGTDIYRDCFLWGSNVTGYDTPSSYLFAIAKYASISNTVKEAYPDVFPQNIYAKWRKVGGVLETADNFIDKYFASNLEGIPECLINLNYRNKYLYDYAQHKASFVISESIHGRGVEETRDWLRGRLHILDAYFNLRNAEIGIYGNIMEPKHNQDVSGNRDIYILTDIFANNNETIGRKSSLTFTVNAADYSPLCVRVGNGYLWYLFEDSTVNYETNVPVSPVQATIFGGSQLWRSLDSIDSFITSRDQTGSAFIFNTNTIDTLVGTTGIQTGNWSIIAPALKTIQLTSPNYAGTLTINSSFESLNDINISNSAISLKMSQSTVKTLNASNLRNSGTISITDCTELTSVNLNNSIIGVCSIIPTWTDNLNFSSVRVEQLTLKAPTTNGSLTIANNAVIRTLEFSNMKTINISNCSSLQSVLCTDSDGDSILENFTVTNCNTLTSITIKSSNLKTINLSSCSALEEITIIGHDFSAVRILNLRGTSLRKITFVNDSTGVTTIQDNGVFDFSAFTNLATSDSASISYVNLGENKNLVSVQFYYPNTTRLFYNFQGCDNLERLYGQFSIKCTNCFYTCYAFSIHGADLATLTWNGSAVRESTGYVHHPTELFTGDIRNQVISATGLTKMWFGISSGSGNFRNTNCTIFDMYYIMDMCDKEVNTTNLDYLFYQNRNSTYGRFNWTATYDNSPHIKMFEHCTHITRAYYFCNGSGVIRFKSPTHTNSEVSADDGLFSSLTSLQSINWWFAGYTIVIDRFCWRRLNGDYVITTFNDFRPRYIINNVNTISYGDISSLSSDNIGDISGFFINLPNISGTVNGLFGSTIFLNYSTIAGIPDGITTLRASFNCDYGTGNISFRNMFSDSTMLSYLYHSFKVGNVLSGVSAPVIQLTNSTFSRFVPRDGYSGLVDIGYDRTNSNYLAEGPLQASLSGALIKQLPIEGFPFNIFKDLTNLRMAVGVFRNATVSSNQNYNNLQLPGNLFVNNTQLRNCAAEFYDIKVNYTISKPYKIVYYANNIDLAHIDQAECGYTIDRSDNTRSINFINCTNLENVAYLFGGSSGDYIPYLSGQIPKNLFWHGAIVEPEILYGANTREQDPETSEYIYVEATDYRINITPTATISDMNYCFAHCNCSAYLHDTNSEIGYDYEWNPDYSPFVYVKRDGEFYSNTNRDQQRFTVDYSYDGATSYSTFKTNDYKISDFVDWTVYLQDSSRRYEPGSSSWLENDGANTHDIKPEVVERFICAPDLLRYCTSNCAVSYLFADSGVRGMNSRWQVSSDLNNNKYIFGIKGRICSYLLKPVSETTDVSGMFSACKCLSYITDRASDLDYILPEDFFEYATSVNKLQHFFERSVQPNKVAMTEVFKPLKGHEIDIQYIFDLCWWSGTSASPTEINGIFALNPIQALRGAFRGNTSIDSDTQMPYNQYVTFISVFLQNRYNVGTYVSHDDFTYCFYGYGSATDLTQEQSLSTRAESYNYTRTV